MFHSRVHIKAGDLVIIFISRDNMLSVIVSPGEVFHNKYGRYAHDDMIGQKFGSKIHSPPPHSGYVHLLRPSPELWTLSLPHRTQILYMPDIAYITMRLGVRVGGKVIDAGTGSGSMTHSLARAAGERGKVKSFEYHRMRYEKAGEEFRSHGLDNVHLEHRNVCKDGFGELSGVEAVFLDLPAPWEAIPHAIKTFRPDVIAKICCFSPCIEQVLKTVSTLRAEGFSDVSTQEVLSRTHELGQPSSASHLIDVSSIQKRLSDHETRKEERRIVQMRTAREKARRPKEAARLAATENVKEVDEVPKESEFGHKRKLEEVNVDKNEETDDFELKKRKVDGEGEDNGVKAPTDLPPSPSSPQAAAVEASPINQKKGDLSVTNGDLPSLHTTKTRTPPKWIEPPNTLSSLVLTKPPAEMRGHTSYLTFASFYPASIRQQLALQEPSRIGVARVAELAGEGEGGRREGSVDTEFGSEGMDQVMGTLTEEEMIALVAGQ